MRFAPIDVHHHQLVCSPGVHALLADVVQGLSETLSHLGRGVCEKSFFSYLRASSLSGFVRQPSAVPSGMRRRGVGQVNENPGTMASRSKPTM